MKPLHRNFPGYGIATLILLAATISPCRANSAVPSISTTPVTASSSDRAEGFRDFLGTPAEETPTETPSDPEEEKSETAAPDPNLQILIEADKLYQAGDIRAAETLYRQAKPPWPQNPDSPIEPLSAPITDPQLLTPGCGVYWREAQAGLESNLETRIFVPLKFLVEQCPQFLPGHITLATAHQKYSRLPDAVAVMERATTFYPDDPQLLRTKIEVLVASKLWLEASIAARRFSLLNPEHPDAAEFTLIADENLGKFRSYIRKMITGNAIANVITGAASIALTGNPLGALSAVETLMLLSKGESGIGESVAKDARENLPMVEDEEVVAYVNEIGQKLAKVAGRSDFEYEFYVILDPEINAFALPGGKVFVNAGAIVNSDSEAELAGLLAHELAHAVLSHGFQMVTHGNLVSSIARSFPFGGTLTNLLVLDYSRDMERQADLLGTRILVAAGYAADGLRNLMVALKEKYGSSSPILKGLSSHPPTLERITYLETLILRNGYNRYTYEGVETHQKIKARVISLLDEESPESTTPDEESPESTTPDQETTND